MSVSHISARTSCRISGSIGGNTCDYDGCGGSSLDFLFFFWCCIRSLCHQFLCGSNLVNFCLKIANKIYTLFILCWLMKRIIIIFCGHHLYLSNDNQIHRETFLLNKNKDEYPIWNTICVGRQLINSLFVATHRICTPPSVLVFVYFHCTCRSFPKYSLLHNSNRNCFLQSNGRKIHS